MRVLALSSLNGGDPINGACKHLTPSGGIPAAELSSQLSLSGVNLINGAANLVGL